MMTWMLAVALGHPVRLPSGEDLEAWSSVLELVGLEATELEPNEGTWVSVTAVGEGWQLRAVDSDGDVHQASVQAPTTSADREAVAQLAASLVRALDTPSLPPLPPLPALPEPDLRPQPEMVVSPRAPGPRPAPAPTPLVSPQAPTPLVSPQASTPRPAPAPTLVLPDSGGPPTPEVVPAGEARDEPSSIASPPLGGAVPELAPVAPSEPAARIDEPPAGGLVPFAWGSVALHMRPSVLPAVAAGVWGGVEGTWGRLGAGVEGTAPAALTGLDVEARVQRTSAWLGGWGRLGPVEVGGVGGGQLHRYVDGAGVDGVAVPTVGLSVAAFPVRALRLEARVHRDLRAVEVFVGEDRVQVAEPWSVELGVALVPWRRADGVLRR